VRKSPGPFKGKEKMKGVRLSNSFAAIGRGNLDKEDDEGAALRTPITFLEVFEKCLSSNDKGKGIVGDQGEGFPLREGSHQPGDGDPFLECKGS